jgi:hypothetical protein
MSSSTQKKMDGRERREAEKELEMQDFRILSHFS